MHRMTQSKTIYTVVASMALALCAGAGIPQASAQPPSVRQANIDYEASGFVTPAGMVPPSMYSGGVSPAGFFGSSGGYGSTGGYGSSGGYGCDAPGVCDGMGSCGSQGCGGGCSMGCGGSSCGILGCGGILGKLSGSGNACGGCGTSGCGSCGGLTNLRHMCMFCRGDGCSACQYFGRGYLLGALHSIKPYGKLGTQRWYDISVEAVFLGHTKGGVGGPATTLGVAPGVAGDPVPTNQVVLGLGDGNAGQDLEAGARLSAAFIWGPGGNIEFTYMGGQRWNRRASVSDPAAGLYSFVSDFGRNPPGGFDDTDRSILQSVDSISEFHSGEINYRRRTMGPYSRFQGSWLVGLRYIRYNDGLIYSSLGEMDNAVNANLPRFFSSNDAVENNLFGPQVGFDMWWNIHPGVRVGCGFKGAWVQNEINRRTTLTSNSLAPGGTPGITTIAGGDQESTVMGEFEAKLIYRISHSWALRGAYYAIAVDDIAFGNADSQTISDFVAANPLAQPQLSFNSLVVQGASLGAEYTW